MNRRFLLTLSMLIILPLISSCMVLVAGGAGAGSVAYIKGDLNANLEAPLNRAVSATNRAITALKFAKISDAYDVYSSRIIARTASDRKITIKLEKASESTTRISIRVGMFGDEEVSNTILREINKRL
ncbi:Protein of unknown function (DUF3568) [Mariprofundus ferrinatatus]|uniref:DUF3568 family protein n=1 Tax=Mariprofundus ferrinatatus TaxID=1921087 RepID=A0A2K8L3R7_9PROT|nr:DUF3568 family protein [Mariprofundus ferrinatatus]ATX81927.1 Protein of unknown function (DUF3568) [Mariprofundus ferrinatatus]